MLIDLRSDTVTRPTAAMRHAMAHAEVGDDVLDGDPTVGRLEARVAELLGKDAGLFFPTGSMANLTGVATLSTWGSEVLLDANAHLIHGEMAAMAPLCGVQIRPVPPDPARLVMAADDLRRAMRAPSKHDAVISLVCLENTHNGAGGVVTPLAELQALRAVAEEFCLPVHMDGARLWNASVASGTSLAEFAACADTVMLSFSKGLGCPVGAILVGDSGTIHRAYAIRKRFGGGMRQSGVLAAAALHALDAHMDRLGDDHENARALARSIDGAGGAKVVFPDTNIVMIDLPDGVAGERVVAHAKACGVLVSEWSPTRLRAVTHLDADADAVARASEILSAALDACAVVSRHAPV